VRHHRTRAGQIFPSRFDDAGATGARCRTPYTCCLRIQSVRGRSPSPVYSHANVFATLPNEVAELILAHGLEGDDKFVTASAGHFLIKFCSLSNASRALFTRSHHLLCPRTLAAFNRRARDRLLTALLAYCNEAFIAKLKSPRTRARACVEFVNAVSRSSWRVELRWDAWVGRPVSREGLLAYGRITVFNSRACLLYVWER
jgi:hypothetical protein